MQIKFVKENWTALLLCFFAMYVMYKSSYRVEVAEREVEKYKLELDSINNSNKYIK